ncbi:hypothetical protein JCM15519_27750 [Fundidesulfovibrio butyratiphilus]
MPTLPVFPIIKRAFVFLALNLKTLIKLYATALGLVLAAAALGAGGYALTKTWLATVPCVVFCVFAITPCMLRTYQLAALGEMDPSSYLSAVFTSQSLRYVGYWLFAGVTLTVGLILALLPGMLAGAVGEVTVINADKALSIMISVGLVMAFLVLFCPVYLAFPAAALERAPSFSQAYALGAHCKMRLFLLMAMPWALFSVLGQVVEMIGGHYGAAEDLRKTLLLAPLNLILFFMASVINAAVFALAYRFLRGLPHHDSCGPLPGETTFWPANVGPGGQDQRSAPIPSDAPKPDPADPAADATRSPGEDPSGTPRH